MFDIVLQFNASEKNKVTKDVTDVLTLTGELRSETSIVDPVILVSGDLSTISGCNYMTISVFGRSYFITNIRSIRTGLIEISAHVDVISSFADEIKTNRAIIRKQENQWNLYLNDGSFKVYQNPMVLTKAFPSGFTTQEFVLAVAGSPST